MISDLDWWVLQISLLLSKIAKYFISNSKQSQLKKLVKENSVSVSREKKKLIVEDLKLKRNKFDNSVTSTNTYTSKVSYFL